MSQGGEVSTQQLVYGPDGQVYGNPAQARAAGVNQYYREDGTPYPVAQQPVPIPSFGGLGGTDPYSRIMGQMGGGTDPYSRIMGQMPLLQNPYASMSGGYNNFQGGYNPNMYSNPAATRAIRQLGFGGGDGGGGGSEPAAPSAWSSMTPAQQAAYYAANPMMATITQLGQKAFGLTSMGALQRAMNPGFVNDQSLIAMGVNPAAYQAAKESFRASEIADMNAAAEAAQTEANRQAAQESFRAGEIAQQNNPTTTSDSPGGGDFGGSGYDGGMFSGAQSGDVGFAMGGPVDRVGGPNPPGPDDGTGMLQLGEYVIKKSAVKKYGAGLLDMINAGKIPAKKMKSLLG